MFVRFSTRPAAVNPAITLAPKPFIAVCIHIEPIAVIVNWSDTGIPSLICSHIVLKSGFRSAAVIFTFSLQRKTYMPVSTAAIISDTRVAQAAPSTPHPNCFTNNRSRTKFTPTLIIKKYSGFLLSPTALDIAVKLLDSIWNGIPRYSTFTYLWLRSIISSGVFISFSRGRDSSSATATMKIPITAATVTLEPE